MGFVVRGSGLWGLGFRVFFNGLGFRVFRLQGLVVWDLRFKAWGLGFSGFRVCRVQGVRSRVWVIPPRVTRSTQSTMPAPQRAKAGKPQFQTLGPKILG